MEVKRLVNVKALGQRRPTLSCSFFFFYSNLKKKKIERILKFTAKVILYVQPFTELFNGKYCFLSPHSFIINERKGFLIIGQYRRLSFQSIAKI